LLACLADLLGRRLVRAAAPPVTESEFLGLSARLTDRQNLDRVAARIYLQALLASPAAAAALAELVRGHPQPDLERRIIAAWYTGVCSFQGSTATGNHTGALMWLAVSGSAPGVCAAGYAPWARPPASRP
jgi:hypothetical protein